MAEAISPSVTPATNSEVLPGYTLVSFDLEHFEVLEQAFADQYRSGVVRFAMGQPAGIAERFIDAAERLIAENHFRFGGFAFDAKVNAQTSAPLLLWACLSIRRPQTTREEAAKLYRDHPDKAALRTVVLAMLGYAGAVKNAVAGAGSTVTTEPSPAPAPIPGSPSSST